MLPVAIVDNHTHLYSAHIRSGEQRYTETGEILPPVLLDTLLTGMEQSGVKAAITSGCEYPELAGTLALARDYDPIWAALAIHPNDVPMHAQSYEMGADGISWDYKPHHLQVSLPEAIEQVAQLAQDPAVVAIGETGLDFFRTGESGKEAQKYAFREHIALAKELGKPLQIHDRDAHREVVEVLLEVGAPEKTVFHCFSGDAEFAQILAEHNWYASFAGPLTYPVNTELQAAFLALPPELILVETDAPYLTPVPYRGHPNTVWGATYTARFMAQLRGVELANWCAQLADNNQEVYGF